MSNEDPAVTNFRTYLRINTVQPSPDYGEADKFHKAMADDIGLEYQSIDVVPGKPMNILTWKGQDPSLPSVMLYSHTDVVPVFPEHWKYEPFGAHKDEKGDIFARGAQDMKCVGMQYLEAIRRLKKDGVKLKRTVHVVFGPDEEIGGKDGMMQFVHFQAFKDLNVGFGLDEGISSPSSVFRLFYGQRSNWWVTITFTGQPGHGSGFIQNTAIAKLNKLITHVLKFRDEQEQKLKDDPSLTVGDVTTVNITMLKGGVQFNVVPDKMGACIDFRLAITVDFDEFEARLHQWCKEISSDYSIEFTLKTLCNEKTAVDSSSPWWVAFDSAIQKLGIEIKKEVFPAGTDGRFMRKIGIPVYGFSPINNTPILLHDHNEYLNEKVYLRGIEIYQEIIPALANVTA